MFVYETRGVSSGAIRWSKLYVKFNQFNDILFLHSSLSSLVLTNCVISYFKFATTQFESKFFPTFVLHFVTFQCDQYSSHNVGICITS